MILMSYKTTHELRKKTEVNFKRVLGERSVLIWGKKGFNRKPELAEIERRVNAKYYVDFLRSLLILWAETVLEEKLILQQGSTILRFSCMSMGLLDEIDKDSSDWLSKSPIFKTIEGIRSNLSVIFIC